MRFKRVLGVIELLLGLGRLSSRRKGSLMLKFTPPSRFVHRSIASALIALAGFAFAAQAGAQSTTEETSHIAVVKGGDVYIRCGAAESYYPFSKVNAGDMVKVMG